MSDPIFQLNGKVIRSAKVEHNQLQSISLYAHDDEDSKFKALSLNEDRELLVSNEGKQIIKYYLLMKLLIREQKTEKIFQFL
jgi:hypothetical protein